MESLFASSWAVALGAHVYLGSSAGGLLVWGLLARGLLLVACTSLASVAWQLRGLAGSQGQLPATSQLRAYYRDFGVRALFFWPTLLWPLAALPAELADLALVALPSFAALAAAAGAVVGGAAARVGAATALAALLSIDAAHALVYPWDSLLLEALWLAQALPALGPSWTSLAASALPLPLIAFGFRLLSARLLLGFGLLKFAAAGKGDHNYIAHFLIAQPVVSPVGFAAHGALPRWFWRAALVGMFVVEVALPLAALAAPAAWGGVRLLFSVSTIALMCGIQLTGNFGFFNILAAVLVLSHAHHSASLFDTRWGGHLALEAAAVLYFVPAVMTALPFNSWVNLSWPHWPGWRLLRPAWLFDWLPAGLRAVAQLRAVAAYGVFPPSAFPAQRWVVQYEVRVATAVAKPLAPAPWLPVRTRFHAQARAFVAPYHPRVDHGLFYEAIGLTSYTPAGVLGHHSPYKAAGWASSDWMRLLLRVASSHLPGGLRRGADTLALLAPAPASNRARVALQFAVANVTVLPAPFWRRRDAPATVDADEGTSQRRLSRPQHDMPHPDFQGWEYVGPLVQARALLKLQLPDHSHCAWSETVAGVHLPAVTALHLLRRGSGGSPASGGGASAMAEPAWALAQDEGFLALEAGDISAPSDFSPDTVHWRRAALASPARPTPEDEELAWRVLAELRAAAIAEALGRAAGAAGSVTPATPAVPGSVAETVSRTRLLVDTPAATLAAAAARAEAAGPTGMIDVASASALFSFAQLPGVAVALRTAFSPLQLRRAEAAINLLALPLLETLEDAFWRPPPSPAELAAELAAAGLEAGDEWSLWYSQLGSMIEGTPAQPCGRPPPSAADAAFWKSSQPPPPQQLPCYVDARAVSYALLAFADNDDSGMPGCLRNAWRLGMYSKWLLLVGGRDSYIARSGDSAGNVAVRLRRVVPGAAAGLGPQHMGSEAGSFVHGALKYDLYAAFARRAASVGLLPRPARVLPPAKMSPLPGFVELADRLAAHHARMRLWEPAGERLVAGLEAPAWGLDASDDWVLLAAPTEAGGVAESLRAVEPRE